MRKTIAISILTTVFCGLLGWAATELGKIPLNQQRISNLEQRQKEDRQDTKEVRRMVGEIHWFLIKRKNIEVPSKDK